MQHKEEIKPADLDRYRPELLGALEAIYQSRQFRTSPKSCEFLGYIVRQALCGSLDELKERLIGITLLGRTANYDTGSDAGVRVRANDVRKRLGAYQTANERDDEFTIELPAGSYIPRFFRFSSPRVDAQPSLSEPTHVSQAQRSVPPISLQSLAFPTLAALFLCTICIRWQLTQEHPFTIFWQTALQDRRAFLYLPPSGDGSESISRASLEAVAPLLNLAGQYHTPFVFTRAPEPVLSSNDILVTVGTAETQNELLASTGGRAPLLDRMIVEKTQQGRQIVQFTKSGPSNPLSGRAALLTISSGPRREIQIDGTDDLAISTLIKQLCERDTFPEDLSDSFQANTLTQAVFLLGATVEVRVFHEPLPNSRPVPLNQ